MEQGTAYYLRFIEKFPQVSDLANAEDEEVMKLWEGLGYYNRCRNLLATARQVTEEHQGVFPSHYEGLLSLKGIGPYTAAAIASFAYNLPYAVVDGNVIRVLSRFFAIRTPVDSLSSKKKMEVLAQMLLDKQHPGKYNQAIMDFGATVCKPRQPECNTCILQSQCGAYRLNITESLPVKSKKTEKKSMGFLYVVYRYSSFIYLHKRNEKDIWRGLYDFVLIETDQETLHQDAHIKAMTLKKSPARSHLTFLSGLYKQQLSHRTIHARFIFVDLPKPISQTGLEQVSVKDLSQYSFPRIVRQFMEENAGYFH